MTRHSPHELDQFSDRVGQALAETAQRGVPVASRHAARFEQLLAERARARLPLHVECEAAGHFVLEQTAVYHPDR